MAYKAKRTQKRLERPGHKVIGRRTKKLLKKADSAVRRLQDEDDGEALHDARVALRRLRSWFQAFRDELHLKRKEKRELRRLAHSTNDARDAEVGLQWLSEMTPRENSQFGARAARFSSDLKMLREESYGKVRRELPSTWRRLSRKLAHVAKHVDKPKAPFRKRFEHSLDDYARDFEQARLEARRHPTAPNIHALRIAGKKLCYLTDNALGKAPLTSGFLREMDALHDSAGRIQDLQRILALSEDDFLHRADGRYRRLLLSDTSRHPRLTPDLEPFLQVGRAAAREQVQRIAHFRKAYLGSRRPACLRELHELMQHIRKLN